eukprot:TRINITY_DN712_c0_g1_i1.p1 TRINITY_DN712_c0_g1~~TRINITY_DN712_c0_g1_i1.p1  ORF type:complete len:183 (-),score=34.35 TRINITY_DN712_c0_g1_i1:360-908(-)
MISAVCSCGHMAAGKTSVCQHFKAQGFGFYSLSDLIREEAQTLGKESNRDNLREIGNSLRNEFGPSVLADRVCLKLEPERSYVIDSIRHPLEVASLRQSIPEFRLLHVNAPVKLRYERLHPRGRVGDDVTFEEFSRQEAAEEAHPDPNGQQQKAVEGLCDLTVSNDGTIGEFDAKLKEMFPL